jgi:ferritin-like metal-binding protein YciE
VILGLAKGINRQEIMKKGLIKKEVSQPLHMLFRNQPETYVKPNAAQGLRDLFVDELKYLYWAEGAFSRSLHNMIANASSDNLSSTLVTYLHTSKVQVARLKKIFSFLGEPVEAVKCEAMMGLIKETEQIMIETEKGMVRDAGIIFACQKIKHYEIATYGTLCSFAKTLGEYKSAALLQKSLIEEKSADKILSEIAESSINIHATSIHDQIYDMYQA